MRQLQNEVRRLVALAEPNAVLTPDKLSEEVVNATVRLNGPSAGPDTTSGNRPDHGDQQLSEQQLIVPLNEKLLPAVSKLEREMIRRALRDHHSSLDDAARALGISRKGLYLKRQRLGL